MDRQKTKNLAILVLGLAAFFFYSGMYNASIMAWIWPVCMLWLLRVNRKPSVLLLLCAMMAVLSCIKWYGVAAGTFVENVTVGLLLVIFPCIPLMLDYFFYQKIAGFKATLLFPLTFAAEEFLFQLTSIATIGSVSSTQTGNDSLIQIAAVFGSYSISLLVTWFATTVLYIWENHTARPEKIRKAVAAYLSVLVTVLSYGGIRLACADVTVPNIKIAVTTGPYIGDFMTGDWEPVTLQENISSMKTTVYTAASGKADLLLYCEEAFTIQDTDEASMLEETQKAAKSNNICVLLAMEVADTDNSQNGLCDNLAYLIDNKGNIVWKYDKTNLVGFAEGDSVKEGDGAVPNETLRMPNGQTVRLSSVICYDSDFPSFIRQKVDDDTDILLVPTWDWAPIRAFHTKWVELRAVENGVSLVRSTMDGISCATDSYGRVIMQSDTAGTGYENVVFAQVPVNSLRTVYEMAGSVIDWCYVAGLLYLLGIAVLKKKP